MLSRAKHLGLRRYRPFAFAQGDIHQDQLDAVLDGRGGNTEVLIIAVTTAMGKME